MSPTVEPLRGKGRLSVQRATAAGNLWEGAVRSVKTVSSTLKWIQFVRQAPDGELLMIGKTERTLKRNVIDPMVSYLGPRRCRYIAGAGEVRLLGRRIYVTGANNELSADKIQGMTLAGWYGDELSTWPASVFKMARTRLSVEGAQWFGTSNPASPAHWLKAEWIDRAKLHITREGTVETFADGIDLHVFSFTLDDNPWLNPTFVANLKREYVGLFYRRYILGEWVQAEGAIYDMFDPARNVIEPARVPPIRRWISAGIDVGTRNPTYAVLLGLGHDIGSQDGAALYAVDEWRHDGRAEHHSLAPSEQSARLRAWLRDVPASPGVRGVAPEYVCVDPSAAGLRVQLYRDGLSTVAADNDVLPGIGTNMSLLANNKLYLSKRCVQLAKYLPGYSWDDKAALVGEDKPIKVNDHECDALRYGDHTTREMWHSEVYPLGV
jgi:PBSX family phage terminase large subunit